MPVTEYEVYSDERYEGNNALLGALIVTNKGRERLTKKIQQIRRDFGLRKELKWRKISEPHLPGYKALLDAFFTDPYARFVYTKTRKKLTGDKKDWFKKFLDTVIGRPRDLKAWCVFHDKGFFHYSDDLKKVRSRIDRQYWGLYQKHTIRSAKEVDSKQQDLIQLADTLLGAVAHAKSTLPNSRPRRELVMYLRDQWDRHPKTRKKLEKISHL
jgi:hypothetical protein